MSDRSPRIERGAALLDSRIPGWERQIDPMMLDLSSPCNCVLGQLYGDYDQGLEALDGEAERHPVAFGFVARGNEDYGSLTEKWRAFIARRRNRASAA